MIKRFIFPYLNRGFYSKLASGSLSALEVDQAYKEIVSKTKTTQKKYRVFSVLVLGVLGLYVGYHVYMFFHLTTIINMDNFQFAFLINLHLRQIVLVLFISVLVLLLLEFIGVYGLERRFLRAHRIGYPFVGKEELIDRQVELVNNAACQQCGGVEFKESFGQQVCVSCLAIIYLPTDESDLKEIRIIKRSKLRVLKLSLIGIAVIGLLISEWSVWNVIGSPLHQHRIQAEMQEQERIGKDYIETISGWSTEIFEAIVVAEAKEIDGEVIFVGGDPFEELVGIVGSPNWITTHRDANRPFSVARWHSFGHSRFLSTSIVEIFFHVDTNIIYVKNIRGSGVADWSEVEKGLELIHYLPGWTPEIFMSIELATGHSYSDDDFGVATYTGGGSWSELLGRVGEPNNIRVNDHGVARANWTYARIGGHSVHVNIYFVEDLDMIVEKRIKGRERWQ